MENNKINNKINIEWDDWDDEEFDPNDFVYDIPYQDAVDRYNKREFIIKDDSVYKNQQLDIKLFKSIMKIEYKRYRRISQSYNYILLWYSRKDINYSNVIKTNSYRYIDIELFN